MTTRQIVITGLLGAIVAVMYYVPYLGFIPLPFSPAGHATLMHVPVILAGILEGPVVGGVVGALFGFFSLIHPAAAVFFRDPVIAFGPRILIGVFAYYAYALVRQRPARVAVTVIVGLAVGRTVQEVGLFLNANWTTAGYVPGLLGRLFHPLTAQTTVWAIVAGAIGLAVACLGWMVLRGENAPPAMGAIVGTLTNTILVLSLIVIRFKAFTPGIAFFTGLTYGLPELIVAVLLVTPLYRGVRAYLDRGR